MVRLKNRYLLVHILYPTDEAGKSSKKAPAPSPQQLVSASIIPDHIRFHQPTPDALTPQLLTGTIRAEIAILYGDYGVGVTGGSLSVKYLSPATSTFILRVSRSHYRLAWAALSFMTLLPSPVSRPCVMRVVRVSGTIKKAEEEAIRRARESMFRVRALVVGCGGGGGGGGGFGLVRDDGFVKDLAGGKAEVEVDLGEDEDDGSIADGSSDEEDVGDEVG